MGGSGRGDGEHTKGILAENQGAASNLIHKPGSLIRGGKINTSLKDAAAVAMGGNLDAVLHSCIVDEDRVFCPKPLKAPLNDMIPIEILDEGHHARAEGLNNNADLLLPREGFYDLLNCTGPVSVKSHTYKVAAFSDALQDLKGHMSSAKTRRKDEAHL